MNVKTGILCGDSRLHDTDVVSNLGSTQKIPSLTNAKKMHYSKSSRAFSLSNDAAMDEKKLECSSYGDLYLIGKKNSHLFHYRVELGIEFYE